jgi:UDPglucose--hexose-1-phosphate uridylyltransferase
VVNGAVDVWCPGASTSAFALRLALAAGGARFDQATDADARATGAALRLAIDALYRVLGTVPYNVVVETAPRDHEGPFRWWVDLIPRVTVTAGFETGTGLYVNVVDPADAAAALRAAIGG